MAQNDTNVSYVYATWLLLTLALILKVENIRNQQKHFPKHQKTYIRARRDLKRTFLVANVLNIQSVEIKSCCISLILAFLCCIHLQYRWTVTLVIDIVIIMFVYYRAVHAVQCAVLLSRASVCPSLCLSAVICNVDAPWSYMLAFLVFAPRSPNIGDLVQGEHLQILRGIGVGVLAEYLQYNCLLYFTIRCFFQAYHDNLK